MIPLRNRNSSGNPNQGCARHEKIDEKVLHLLIHSYQAEGGAQHEGNVCKQAKPAFEFELKKT
jgi:hypothetical protein